MTVRATGVGGPVVTGFTIRRDDLQQTRFVAAPLGRELEDGEALLRIDRFAFTANNITYAELGDRLAYWKFFPAADDAFGQIPVWGFADVLVSEHDAIAPGERIFGFYPMATHMVVRPGKLRDGGFVDATPHRADLPPAYNHYARAAGDPSYAPDHEGLQSLLRPLFITSFLIDDFLADEKFYGAKAVILSSASSKTAFGLAHLLHKRGGIEVIGLTSPRNRSFVAGLGCYDRVVLYDEIASLDAAQPAVFVDFAGSAGVRTAVHEHFGGALRCSCAVGLSHRETNPPGKGLPGATPVFFFAPDRIRKRTKDWGRGGIDARFAEVWRAFVPVASGWLTVVEGRGPAAVEAVYRATLAGRVTPHEGHILSLWN